MDDKKIMNTEKFFNVVPKRRSFFEKRRRREYQRIDGVFRSRVSGHRLSLDSCYFLFYTLERAVEGTRL